MDLILILGLIAYGAIAIIASTLAFRWQKIDYEMVACCFILGFTTVAVLVIGLR